MFLLYFLPLQPNPGNNQTIVLLFLFIGILIEINKTFLHLPLQKNIILKKAQVYFYIFNLQYFPEIAKVFIEDFYCF